MGFEFDMGVLIRGILSGPGGAYTAPQYGYTFVQQGK